MTCWSVVLRVRHTTLDAGAALAALCRTYRPPVLAYIRRCGYREDAAEGLVQSFFTRFIERAWHATAEPQRGRFRTFLLTTVRRFLIDCDQEAHRLKRGSAFHFEMLGDSGGLDMATDDTPDAALERDWAIAVLNAAFVHLRSEAQQVGTLELFEQQLNPFMTERPDAADCARPAGRG